MSDVTTVKHHTLDLKRPDHYLELSVSFLLSCLIVNNWTRQFWHFSLSLAVNFQVSDDWRSEKRSSMRFFLKTTCPWIVVANSPLILSVRDVLTFWQWFTSDPIYWLILSPVGWRHTNYTVSQKINVVSNFYSRLTSSSVNRFWKFFHCWKQQ